MHTKKPLQLYDKQLKAVGVTPVEEIDEWIYFFKHEEIREDFTSPAILLASQRLDLLLMDKSERINYEKYLAYLASERNILTTAKEEGMAEGWEEGIRQGKSDLIFKLLQKKFKQIPEEYQCDI